MQGFLYCFFAQLRTSSGKTQESRGVDEAEQCDGGQYLFFAQRFLLFQWGAGNGA